MQLLGFGFWLNIWFFKFVFMLYQVSKVGIFCSRDFFEITIFGSCEIFT